MSVSAARKRAPSVSPLPPLRQDRPQPRRLIDGVIVKPLKWIPDERGRLMEVLRADDPCFERFGQVYVTTVLPGVVKGWHYHKQQTDYFACVAGMIKLVLYDDRSGSKTRGAVNEFFIGIYSPLLVTVPPLVWHGFKGVGETEAVVMNAPTYPYNHQQPDEFRLNPQTPHIPYDWSRQDH